MIKKATQFIHKHQKVISIIIAVFAFVFFVNFAHAGLAESLFGAIKDGFISVIQFITQVIINLLGKIMIFLMTFLVDIATYNNFGDSPVINAGWRTVRDLSNLLIVIGLLYISFRSVTGNSKYKLSSNLSKLVGIAILVNFSKTITLILIDISQVVMLTFVKSFASIGAGNLQDILKIDKFFDTGANPDLSGTGALAGMIFIVLLMLIVDAVIGLVMLTLMYRIVALWILVIVSPLAIALFAVPFEKLQKIKTMWVDELTNWLLIGPLLAFFIWLTFTSLNSTDNALGFSKEKMAAGGKIVKSAGELSAAGSYEQLAGFILAVVMLVYGVKFSAEASGGAGKLAGQLSTDIINKGNKIKSGAFDATKKATNKTLKFAKNLPSDALTGIARASGKDSTAAKIVKGSKKLKENIKSIAPSKLFPALYRRAVLQEKGAVKGARSEAKENIFKDEVKKIEEEGRNVEESKMKMEAIRNGDYGDMTLTQIMAEMEIAKNNGALQSDEDYIAMEQELKDRAKGSKADEDLVTQQTTKWRKDRFSGNSIYQYGTLDEEDANRRIHENVSSLDHERAFKESQVRELDIDESVVRDKNGKVTGVKDEGTFNRKKTALLAYSSVSIAQNTQQDQKDALREKLQKLLETEKLDEDEEKKARELMAATTLDGKSMQKKTTGAEVMQEIGKISNNKAKFAEIEDDIKDAVEYKKKSKKINKKPYQDVRQKYKDDVNKKMAKGATVSDAVDKVHEETKNNKEKMIKAVPKNDRKQKEIEINATIEGLEADKDYMKDEIKFDVKVKKISSATPFSKIANKRDFSTTINKLIAQLYLEKSKKSTTKADKERVDYKIKVIENTSFDPTDLKGSVDMLKSSLESSINKSDLMDFKKHK